MRSARLGNRLIAGVQNSAKFDASTTLSSVGSPRRTGSRARSRSSSTRLSARREPGQLEEPEPLRKREILLQQPIPLERSQRDRQQRLVVGEADRPDRRRRQQLVPPRRALRRQHQHAEAGRQAQLVAACSRRRRARSGRSASRSIAVWANVEPAVVFSRMRTPPLIRWRDRQRVERQIGREGEVARRRRSRPATA